MAAKGSIPKTMKALVAYGRGDYRFEPEYPTPECGPDDIIIKTEGCGVCAGDLKCQHGVAMFWGDEFQPAWVKPPFIPGHEFFGRVVQVGENVTEYDLGDRITADQIVPCGKCRFCKDGHYWMCQPHDMYGYQYYNNGGMAEYVRYVKNSVMNGFTSEGVDLVQTLYIVFAKPSGGIEIISRFSRNPDGAARNIKPYIGRTSEQYFQADRTCIIDFFLTVAFVQRIGFYSQPGLAASAVKATSSVSLT